MQAKRSLFQCIVIFLVIIYGAGVFVLTPFITANYTTDVCRKYSPETIDRNSAATAGFILGLLWPAYYGEKLFRR